MRTVCSLVWSLLVAMVAISLPTIAAALIALLICAALARGAPADAVVRIPSHGCSGTVIASAPGRSYVLTCAHAFDGADLRRPISLDGPAPPGEAGPRAVARVVRIDYRRDLALIEIGRAMPYVCPVAPAPTVGACTSVGYDSMRRPAVAQRATVWSTVGALTYTAERPWHGRSGGALIDRSGRLVGVVQGYEVDHLRRGMYASHPAILEFLRGATPAPRYQARPAPSLPGGT
jgi:hypothetical protein